MSLDLTPAIIGSSVPRGEKNALDYAHRLEKRHYADRGKMIAAAGRLQDLATSAPAWGAVLLEIAHTLL